ncbi:hypothetical protein [Kaistella sp.]|uniref:hypothetical protein n=1 Tax=Kaistella sp. TaxID=2782235 RepID=UPI002F925A7C|nr:hypothetical protein [Kaistella sp.]
MLNRDFFRLLIKITGLYFFIQTVFGVLPSQLGFLGFDSDVSQKIGTFIYIFLIVLLSIGILYYLIRFPDKIINLFKLDEGFDRDTISIKNFNPKNILTLGLFIIGGFLIIENLSSTLAMLFYEFKKSVNPMFPKEKNDSINLLFSALNLILGSCLIIFRKNIAEYFEK